MANCGNDLDKDGKIRSEILIIYGSADKTTTASLHKFVSLCSTEAEHVTFLKAAKTISWLCSLMPDLRFQQKSARVSQEIVRCIEWANGRAGKRFEKQKHIDAEHSYLIVLVRVGLVTVVTSWMTVLRADVLKKSLHAAELACKINATQLFDSTSSKQSMIYSVAAEQ